MGSGGRRVELIIQKILVGWEVRRPQCLQTLSDQNNMCWQLCV